jgi:hypothetical protein
VKACAVGAELIGSAHELRIVMPVWMNDWGWFWMTFMMVFWVVLLGAVVFVAVRLAQRPPREGKQ